MTIEIPSQLEGDRFRDAWRLWCVHRTEIRKPLKRTSVSTLLDKLASWGTDRAVAAIEHTVSNGWQGIREPDQNGKPRAKTGKELF